MYDDGRPMGLSDPLELDIAGGRCAQAYFQLLKVTGAIGETPIRSKVKFVDFKAGSTIFAFTRSADAEQGQNFVSPRRESNVGIRLKLKAAQTFVVQAVVHFVYLNSHFSIDKDNQLTTQYIV